MSAATHASADRFGIAPIAMIGAIIVVARVAVTGLLRRVGCGTGV